MAYFVGYTNIEFLTSSLANGMTKIRVEKRKEKWAIQKKKNVCQDCKIPFACQEIEDCREQFFHRDLPLFHFSLEVHRLVECTWMDRQILYHIL